MRLLPVGDHAILVELDDTGERHALTAALAGRLPDGVVEVVPAAVTVLVRTAPGISLQRVADQLRTLALDDQLPMVPPTRRPDTLTVPVTYDGPDLAEVATHFGIQARAVVAWHTGQLWTVEFAGFAPGFGYLTGDGDGLDVPRRASPRTRIPAGSVAVAGPYSGVYPHASAGGWQIVGTTALAVWDAERDPPALLTPGRPVRFVQVGR